MTAEISDRHRHVLSAAPFISELGLELVTLADGECETTLEIERRHEQQNGFVHAGVQATMADHTAGAAASTLLDDGLMVLSVEFKLNLLRAARGDRLRCRAKVLRGGRRLSVVESEVWCETAIDSRLVSKMVATMAIVPRPAADAGHGVRV
jgi:uncharacterized protein (TIGR00369 family)